MVIAVSGYGIYQFFRYEDSLHNKPSSSDKNAENESESARSIIADHPLINTLPSEDELRLSQDSFEKPATATNIATNLEKAEQARKRKEQIELQMRYGGDNPKSFLEKQDEPPESN